MDTDVQFAIYSNLLDYCEPYIPPSELAFVPADADALALRSLEIPAVTAHGLLSLGPEQMPELTCCFEVDRPRLAPELEDDEDGDPQDEPKIRISDHVPSDEVPFGKIVSFGTSSARDKSPGGESPESDSAEDGAEKAGLFRLEQRFPLTFAP